MKQQQKSTEVHKSRKGWEEAELLSLKPYPALLETQVGKNVT